MTKENITKQIISLLKENVESCANASIEEDTPLLESNLLDSFSMVSLLPVFENTFKITFDIENLDVESFATPSSISDLIITMI